MIADILLSALSLAGMGGVFAVMCGGVVALLHPSNVESEAIEVTFDEEE
jgi:hypothetical protein